MQPSYIGDVSETVTGAASGITPDGTRVIVMARISAKNSNGIVVYRSTDGKNWTTKFFLAPVGITIYGVAFIASTGVIVGMSRTNATTINLYRSTDLGDTWEIKAVTHGVTQVYSGGFNVLVADENRKRLIAYNYSSIGASSDTVRNLAIQSFDNGDTWSSFINVTANGLRVSMGSIPNHDRGIVGRLWGGSTNQVFYTNNTDNSITLVDTNAPSVIYPIDYMKAPVAYNPTYKKYTWYNASSNASGTSPIITFNEDFSQFSEISPTITGNSRLGNIVYYPPTNDTVVVTYRSNSLSQADTKIYKTKTGDGWIEDPTPLYNTAGVQFGPNGLLYDPTLGILSGYIQGDIQQGSGVGYFGIAANMPTPTPSATMSMTPTQLNNTNPVRLYGRQSVVNGVPNSSYSFVSNDGKDTLSVSLGITANENIFGSIHVPNTNELMIWGNYNAVAGDTNTVALGRIDIGGTWNPTFKVTGIGTARNISSVIKIDDNTFIFASVSPGRIFKMDANGVVDISWGTAHTSLSTPNVFLDRNDPTKFYLTTNDRVIRLSVLNAAIDPTFTTVTINNPVSALVSQSDGNVIIYGTFTVVNSNNRTFLARVGNNGVLDRTWNLTIAPNGPAVLTATGTMIVNQDDSIFVTGGFTTVDGISRTGLVKIAANGRVDKTFLPFTNNSAFVYGITRMADGRLLVTGTFSIAQGQARPYVARLMPDGSLDPTFRLSSITTGLQYNSEEYDYPLVSLTPTVTPSVTPTHTPVPSAVYNDSLGFGKAVLVG